MASPLLGLIVEYEPSGEPSELSKLIGNYIISMFTCTHIYDLIHQGSPKGTYGFQFKSRDDMLSPMIFS